MRSERRRFGSCGKATAWSRSRGDWSSSWWAGGRRRLVFAGKTLRGNGRLDAVFPEREAELFDKVNYADVPRMVQLPEERAGNKMEEIRA